jgi:hypothetical protein
MANHHPCWFGDFFFYLLSSLQLVSWWTHLFIIFFRATMQSHQTIKGEMSVFPFAQGRASQTHTHTHTHPHTPKTQQITFRCMLNQARQSMATL